MNKPIISVFGSRTGAEEQANVTESLAGNWLGMGPKLKAFEAEFQQLRALPDFLMVDSGSNALFMAATLLDLPKGSEVILPSFTWVSCAQALLMAGYCPVFADVDPVTMNITAETIAPHITPNTKAIMVMHYAGLPVEMAPIVAMGLPVLEDAAQAVVSAYHGQACGSIGDVGIFSFDAVKNIAAGEGGGVTARDPAKMARARLLRYCGIGKSGFEASTHGKRRWWEYHIAEPFIKMNPSDISAGIALGQLHKLSENQQRRAEVWARYQQELAGMDWIVRPAEAPEGCVHSYFTYAIRVQAPKGQSVGDFRDTLAHTLLDKGIYTTVRYHPLHMNALYGQLDKRLPTCEALNEDSLCLPLHPNLSDDEVARVVAALKNFAS
jgi:aminotransferase